MGELVSLALRVGLLRHVRLEAVALRELVQSLRRHVLIVVVQPVEQGFDIGVHRPLVQLLRLARELSLPLAVERLGLRPQLLRYIVETPRAFYLVRISGWCGVVRDLGGRWVLSLCGVLGACIVGSRAGAVLGLRTRIPASARVRVVHHQGSCVPLSVGGRWPSSTG